MAAGKYIYGIINSNKGESFGPSEITAYGEVYTIPYQDISAVVSDTVITDHIHMTKDVLARLLIGHQKVIERIMSLEHVIIPKKLGTIVLDESEVKDILDKGYSLIKDIMGKISNKVEIDVAATWSDFNSVLKEAGEEKEIREFKERLSANPTAITVNDQMRIGVMVKKALDKKRETHARKIEGALKTVGQGLKGHELMDDKMVANVACLINKSGQKGFDEKVEELNSDFGGKLNFRCVGPLPPYSFYTLEVKKIQFEEIDWARKKLGLLNEFATKDEIKKAHRTLALSFHPDKNPNTPGVEREFNEVTKAYGVLREYCQGDSCSFNEDEFKKNAVLVNVRG